jgi:hypothetical protein
MKKLLVLSCLMALSSVASAQNLQRVFDGQNVRCSSSADLGNTGIQMQVVEVLEQEDINLVTISAKTFKCSLENGELVLKSAPLGDKIANQVSISHSELVVVNSQDLNMVAISEFSKDQTEQEISFGLSKSVQSVDMFVRVLANRGGNGYEGFGAFRLNLTKMHKVNLK